MCEIPIIVATDLLVCRGALATDQEVCRHELITTITMKITGLETIHLPDYPSFLFVAVHTDAGLTGYADTCYMPDAVAGYIHQFAAPMLLGHDPLAIELHWRRLYEVIAHTVGKGAELRGLSAIDVCLWDILGQAAGMPVWQVLGGAARDRIRTYNTCGGPNYGRPAKGGTGYGTDGATRQVRRPDRVHGTARRTGARSARAKGMTGMKIWPFDYVAHFPGGWDNWRSFRGMFDPNIRSLGGHDISAADLDRALEPFRKIREAVGDQMEIMVEGHGLWSLPAALKIAARRRRVPPRVARRPDARRRHRRAGRTAPRHDEPDPRERVPGDALRVQAAAGEAGRRHRDDRPDVGRRHHRVQEGVRDGGDVQAAGRDARLHRPVHALRRASTSRSTPRTRSTRNRCGPTCGSTTRSW